MLFLFNSNNKPDDAKRETSGREEHNILTKEKKKKKQNTISGTSMATPHVAGLGAYFLALLGYKDPEALCEYIKETATIGTVTDIPSDTINAIAYNGATS